MAGSFCLFCGKGAGCNRLVCTSKLTVAAWPGLTPTSTPKSTPIMMASDLEVVLIPATSSRVPSSVSRSWGDCQAANLRTPSESEVSLANARIILHFGGRAAQNDSSILEDVCAARRVQRDEDVLLDQDERCAFAIDLLNDVDQVVDDVGSQAERQLVDHQQLGPGHQPAPDRDHLLLAARQRAGLARELVRKRRKMTEHSPQVVAHLAISPEICAQEQVLLDRHRSKQTAALRNVGDALSHEGFGASMSDVFARERDRPRGGAEQPAQGTEQSGLSGAVGADERDELRMPDVEVDPKEHGPGVEAGRQAADLEQGFRTWCVSHIARRGRPGSRARLGAPPPARPGPGRDPTRARWPGGRPR